MREFKKTLKLLVTLLLLRENATSMEFVAHIFVALNGEIVDWPTILCEILRA